MALRGYSRVQVDELFARIAAGQVTVADLREAQFGKQMRGYAPRDVDAALREEIRRLEGH
jgi:DivIVA domain-containing protein